ncbi:MAG: peroxidase family protein [Bacteroidota bacterium]
MHSQKSSPSPAFRKLFPELAPLHLSDDQLWELSREMVERKKCADSHNITNGEATFGQLLAHDMTFENVSSFQKSFQPPALANERSIGLDLDSTYGLRTESFYYQKKQSSHLLLQGRQDADRLYSWCDVPRNFEGTAIIPDPRDDESIIVSRIHVLFMLFHNQYIRRFLDGYSEAEKFWEARLRVTWFYHWLIVHHYLYKVLDKKICDDIYRNGAKYFRQPNFIPLEFSGAAFRIGHSQSRDVNQLNDTTVAGIFDLGSFEPTNVYVDWSYLFDRGDGKVEFAKKIDTKIAPAFHDIPFLRNETDVRLRSLPFRNLKRGVVYGLPSGESVAKRLCLEPLQILETEKLCLPGTPLWFYILKEAELMHDGEHLGPVGSRIFGEVFFSILKNDPKSYLVQHPKWEPNGLGNAKGVFGFRELINFICD